MTKEDFLKELRSSLSGNVSADVINENLGYYENYINTELRKGRGEDEVLEELGSPRLLAKTVIDTAPSSERRSPESDEDTLNRTDDSSSSVMPWWMIVLIIFAVMIGIYVLANIAAILIPVLIVLAIAFFVIKLFGGGK